MSTTNRLGELLVREKLISLQQLRRAQDEQKRSGQNLGYTLAKLGYISDGEITNFLSAQYRLPAINLDEYEIDSDIIKLVGRDVCEKHKIIPVSRSGSSLIVAMADPTNLHAIDDIKFLTGYNVEPVVSSETAIHAAIERYYNVGPSYEEVLEDFDLGIGGGRYKEAWCDADPLVDVLVPMTWRGRLMAAAARVPQAVRSTIKNNPKLWDLAQKVRKMAGGNRRNRVVTPPDD